MIYMYWSGNTATVYSNKLCVISNTKPVTRVKVVPGNEVALQHQLLACDILIDMPPQIQRKFIPRQCRSSKIIKCVAIIRTYSGHMCALRKLKWLLLPRKSGQSSRHDCVGQQRRYVVQLSSSNGDVRICGYSHSPKHERLATAHGKYMTLPSALPDVWYTMPATK